MRTHIDRLQVRVPAQDESTARALAAEIATALAEQQAGPHDAATGSTPIPHLRIKIAAQPGETSAAIARRVAQTVAQRLSGAS